MKGERSKVKNKRDKGKDKQRERQNIQKIGSKKRDNERKRKNIEKRDKRSDRIQKKETKEVTEYKNKVIDIEIDIENDNNEISLMDDKTG